MASGTEIVGRMYLDAIRSAANQARTQDQIVYVDVMGKTGARKTPNSVASIHPDGCAYGYHEDMPALGHALKKYREERDACPICPVCVDCHHGRHGVAGHSACPCPCHGNAKEARR